MILTIDTTGKQFQVTKPPSPKLDPTGKQRVNKLTGELLWSTQVVVTDEDGGTIIAISTNGRPLDIEVGDLIEPTDLVALPWHTNGRSGVAYTATRIELLKD